MEVLLIVVAGIRIVVGTVADKNASRESYPSSESMKEDSRSSGPTCLSVKVSRESKREEGALAVASHRTLRQARCGGERRASLRADAERKAAMAGRRREGDKERIGELRRDIAGRYSPSQVPAHLITPL